MDFDQVLHSTGSFGLYQKTRFVSYVVASSVLCLFVWLKHMFIIYSPDHWCHVPMDDELAKQYNMTLHQWKHLTIPIEFTVDLVHLPSKCEMYDVNFTEILREHGGKLHGHNQSWPKIPCKYGWDYDRSVFEHTAVTDWDLVCDRDWLPDLTLTMAIVGQFLGTITFGVIMDRFGRRPTFYICLTWILIFGIALPFVSDIATFTVIRTLSSLTVPGSFQITFLLSLEIMTTEKRTVGAMATCIGWSLAILAFSGIAAGFKDWRNLCLVTSVPFVLFYLYAFFLDESPRWLVVNKRYEEAEAICQKIAKVNKRQQKTPFLTEKLLEIEERENRMKKKLTLIHLFKTSIMRKTTIFLLLNWSVNVIAYIGLTVVATRLRVNIFLSMCITGAVETPAHLLPLFFLDRLGRKWPLIGSMLLCGTSLLCIAAVPYEMMWVRFALAMIGKFGISMSFAILYQYAGELFPTVLRGNGMGMGATTGQAAGLLAPQILYLAKYGQYVPMVIFGGLAVLAALAIVPLPETAGEMLPDTVAQAEALGKDQSTFYCYATQGKRAQSREVYKDTKTANNSEITELRDF